MYGAVVTEKYGFRLCCDSVSLICLMFSIVYYFVADGKKSFIVSTWVNYDDIDMQDDLVD